MYNFTLVSFKNVSPSKIRTRVSFGQQEREFTQEKIRKTAWQIGGKENFGVII